jgi:hypothetical protein
MIITNRITWVNNLHIGNVSSQGLVHSIAVKPILSFEFTDLYFEPMLENYKVDDRNLTEIEKDEVDLYCTNFFSNTSSNITFLSNLTAESACNLFMSSTDKIIIKNLEDGTPSDPELIRRRQEIRKVLIGDKIPGAMLDIAQTSTALTTSEFITSIYNTFSLMGN